MKRYEDFTEFEKQVAAALTFTITFPNPGEKLGDYFARAMNGLAPKVAHAIDSAAGGRAQQRDVGLAALKEEL